MLDAEVLDDAGGAIGSYPLDNGGKKTLECVSPWGWIGHGNSSTNAVPLTQGPVDVLRTLGLALFYRRCSTKCRLFYGGGGARRTFARPSESGGANACERGYVAEPREERLKKSIAEKKELGRGHQKPAEKSNRLVSRRRPDPVTVSL